jgi:hypothetical protein
MKETTKLLVAGVMAVLFCSVGKANGTVFYRLKYLSTGQT